MIKTDLEIGLENFLQIEATHFPFKKSLVFCTQISQYKGLSSHLEKNMVGGQGGDFESQHCLSNFFCCIDRESLRDHDYEKRVNNRLVRVFACDATMKLNLDTISSRVCKSLQSCMIND
jgi:hypothetical protein